jgi:DNA primase catalytic core
MSLHKLTAGSGYDYLTRQVAVQDSTEKGRATLASYYVEKGESPGTWVGAGLSGIDGLRSGDVVTAEQMKALFGHGFHPLADQRVAALGLSASATELRVAQRLGTPFKVYTSDAPQLQVEVARRIGDLNVAAGLPRGTKASLEVRARVRGEVGREFFTADHGREPAGARELSASIAKHSRPKTTAVAGYDLTFSPVKSVSALWAVADPQVAAKIEVAHQSAVNDALTFFERYALFTRTGTNGTAQVDVTGLVAAAFTHRDSRAGDPDLHTHVAVANKVQTHDGRWLAIDGRVLFKAKVTASETYNTALEKHLTAGLGVRFVERPGDDPRKRPVREVVGVDPGLNQRWSTRRAHIDARRAVLATAFQAAHGRPPTPAEAIELAQQATLETRYAKHEPRSLGEQRDAWAEQAAEVLGGATAVDRMVAGTLNQPGGNGQKVTAGWVSETAATVVEEVSQRRSTWQVWHVRSEAQRHVRAADVAADQVETVVDLIVDQALSDASVRLTTDRDPIAEPEQLRRRNGQSVYHMAGSDLFTSTTILDAEQRIVTAAGRSDGRRADPHVVDLALLESTANGVVLNAGQTAMVRQMATSGARVQLGIAAAGTGKTTAMSVLTCAWEEDGGNVVGLAPSAAAAAALRDSTGATTDTLGKLVHDITTTSSFIGADRHQAMWDIGRGTLVLIDEAGMADTLTLDAAIGFITGRGASVRLIGDNQQLAAIGAGGVLRDIDQQHGATRLAELMRFADPAEGAATLALREGLPEAVGFYLDNHRVHVGDLTTLTDEVFTRWAGDRAAGHDSIMLAPTRALVAELNARARDARLTDLARTEAGAADAGRVDGPVVGLADGNQASTGDVVITRRNDRRLRVSGADWVKNGDRWHVTGVHGGRLSVRHVTSGLCTTLPADYVAAHTELGYASTVHAAQGVSVDTVHGIATGTESRQQLYTMLTRGRLSNDVYLVVVGDGDEHDLVRPETTHPKTATDILHDILARDEAPLSATTIRRHADDPATLLGPATARYVDALHAGAELLVGVDTVTAIEDAAADLVPGIVDEPAWPVLRAHLVVVQATGRDAVRELTSAVTERELDGVDDRAAILDWRLDPTGLRGQRTGPLPWVPSVPASLVADPVWGPYLQLRSERVQGLAAEVRAAANRAGTELPVWARQGTRHPAPAVLADVAVWRAANSVEPTDRRPSGGRQIAKAAAIYQRRLDKSLNAGRSPALAEWGPLLDTLGVGRDQFTSLLAERLAAVSRAGINAGQLLRQTVTEGPLPVDHASAALWWRISRQLSPTVATQATSRDHTLSAGWVGTLIDVLGSERAAQVQASSWWPALVTQIDHGLQAGWVARDLLNATVPASSADAGASSDADVDLAQAMLWRGALLLAGPPEPDPYDENVPPEDLDQATTLEQPARPDTDVEQVAVADLGHVAWARDLLDPMELTDAQIAVQLDRANTIRLSPTTPERILGINTMAADFYEAKLPGSWAHDHLAERFGQDISSDPRFRPGYAPTGWTNLVNHLRNHGISDQEMLAAGVATTTSTGSLIDRFRDRVVLPIITNGKVLGFIGRRHPDTTDSPQAGPKYLNTADTIVFHKGAQLFGIAASHMANGAIPVLVEGPMDAIAVTLATGGAYIGVAPLGTSLTAEQATQLAGLGVDPIVATDGDLAGQIAAERDYWLLTPHGLNPKLAPMAAGQDAASLLADDSATTLRAALFTAGRLADALIDERLTHLTDKTQATVPTADIIAAQPPTHWSSQIALAAERIGAPPATMRDAVTTAAQAWNDDRQQASRLQLDNTTAVRERMQAAAAATPADRWAPLARDLDPRLIEQPDWPATAAMLQDVHDAGHYLPTLTRELVTQDPLGEAPARDLRYLLVGYLTEENRHVSPAPEPDKPRGARATELERQYRAAHPDTSPIAPPR